MTYPSEYLLCYKVHPPVLGPEVHLALKPGVRTNDKTRAVLRAVA